MKVDDDILYSALEIWVFRDYNKQSKFKLYNVLY